MAKKIAGRIVGVRYSTKTRSSTLIIQMGDVKEEFSLSAKQLLSKAGVVRPHGLKGATVQAELHELGAKIPNPSMPGVFITQTQERLDANRGIKDFDINLTAAQEMQQGQLMVYGDILRETMQAQLAADNAVNAPAAEPEPNVVQQPAEQVEHPELIVAENETADAVTGDEPPF
jgi:hypothetical protein